MFQLLGILFFRNCMFRLEYLIKLVVFERDIYFWIKRVHSSGYIWIMLTFSFDIQNCHKFVPYFSDISPALKKFLATRLVDDKIFTNSCLSFWSYLLKLLHTTFKKPEWPTVFFCNIIIFQSLSPIKRFSAF